MKNLPPFLLTFFALPALLGRAQQGSAQPAGSPANGGVVTTLAGAVGKVGKTNGAGGVARFNYPAAVAAAANGTLYVADGNNVIRKITPAGVVTTLAGVLGAFGPTQGGATNGPGAAARFTSPAGVAVDAAGNVYVADTENHTIRKIAADGTTSTLAGTAGPPGTADGTGPAARFANPMGVAVDAAGTVYVADHDNHTIRRIR